MEDPNSQNRIHPSKPLARSSLPCLKLTLTVLDLLLTLQFCTIPCRLLACLPNCTLPTDSVQTVRPSSTCRSFVRSCVPLTISSRVQDSLSMTRRRIDLVFCCILASDLEGIPIHRTWPRDGCAWQSCSGPACMSAKYSK